MGRNEKVKEIGKTGKKDGQISKHKKKKGRE